MPARSKAQQQMAGADLARAREGKETRTGMSEEQLKHFAKTPTTHLPDRAKAPGETTKKHFKIGRRKVEY